MKFITNYGKSLDDRRVALFRTSGSCMWNHDDEKGTSIGFLRGEGNDAIHTYIVYIEDE